MDIFNETQLFKKCITCLKLKKTEYTVDEMATVIEFLKHYVDFFKWINVDYEGIVPNLCFETFKKETTLCNVGELKKSYSRRFYIILSGTVFVYAPKIVLRGAQEEIRESTTMEEDPDDDKQLLIYGNQEYSLRAGNTFGEECIMQRYLCEGKYKRVVWKTSQAEETMVLSVDYATYRKYIQYPYEMMLDDRVDFMYNLHVPLFKKFPKSVMFEIVKSMKKHQYQPHSVVLKQDDPGNEMFFLVSGNCKAIMHVTVEDCRKRVKKESIKFLELATYDPKEYFGELVLLNYNPSYEVLRQCSIYTIGNQTDILSLDIQNFNQFLTREVIKMMKTYSEGYPTMKEIEEFYISKLKWQQYRAGLVEQVKSKQKIKIRG